MATSYSSSPIVEFVHRFTIRVSTRTISTSDPVSYGIGVAITPVLIVVSCLGMLILCVNCSRFLGFFYRKNFMIFLIAIVVSLTSAYLVFSLDLASVFDLVDETIADFSGLIGKVSTPLNSINTAADNIVFNAGVANTACNDVLTGTGYSFDASQVEAGARSIKDLTYNTVNPFLETIQTSLDSASAYTGPSKTGTIISLVAVFVLVTISHMVISVFTLFNRRFTATVSLVVMFILVVICVSIATIMSFVSIVTADVCADPGPTERLNSIVEDLVGIQDICTDPSYKAVCGYQTCVNSYNPFTEFESATEELSNITAPINTLLDDIKSLPSTVDVTDCNNTLVSIVDDINTISSSITTAITSLDCENVTPIYTKIVQDILCYGIARDTAAMWIIMYTVALSLSCTTLFL